MPKPIHNDDTGSSSLEDVTHALSQLDFDPACEERTGAAANLLRRLTNNRTFLADILVDQLAGRTGGILSGIESQFGPQAIVLSRQLPGASGSVFLRANIWPAENDLCFKTSGARSFVYGVPHDHNFSFLTSGYCGPGYRSDYYEYDYESVSGYAGEPVDLRFVERSALHQGKLMLYRAHLDIHSQLPPEALSVSLNVMHIGPAQCWHDQYGFDLERGEVSKVLSPNSTEAFLRVAVASGSDEALEFADWIGRTHPSERLRLASYEARAARCPDQEAEDALWRSGERSGSRMVAAVAQQRRAALAS